LFVIVSRQADRSPMVFFWVCIGLLRLRSDNVD
jgi:hypothetical protein